MSCSKSCPCHCVWPVDTHEPKLIYKLKDWLIFAVRLLSRKMVGKVNGQEAIWNKKYKPSWWDEEKYGEWKNPTTKGKDNKDDLLIKYSALKTHLQEGKTFPTELEEEANLLEENKIEELLWRRNSIILCGAAKGIITHLKKIKARFSPCMWDEITKLLSTLNNNEGNGRNTDPESGSKLAGNDVPSGGTSKKRKRRNDQANGKGLKKARQQNSTPQSRQGTSKASEKQVVTTSVPAVPKGHSTVASDAISCTIATTSSVLSKKPTIFPVTCNPETVVSPSTVKQNVAGIDVPSCSRIASGAVGSLSTSISCQKTDSSNDRSAVLDAFGSLTSDKDCQSANNSAPPETSSSSPASSTSKIAPDRSDRPSVGTGKNCETDSTASVASLADVPSCSRTCPAKLDSFGTGRTFQNLSDSSEVSMAKVPSDGTAVSDKSDNNVRDFQNSDDSTIIEPQAEVLSGSKASTTSDGSDKVRVGSDSRSPKNHSMSNAGYSNNIPMVELNELFSEEEQHELCGEEGSLLSDKFLHYFR